MATQITDLRNQPLNDTPKPSFGRNKPKNKKFRELSHSEVIRLKERSNGVCEKCDSQRAIDKAHVVRRWNSSVEPVAEDFIHLCKVCHKFADSGSIGRKWLLDKQAEIINKAIAQ